MKNNEAICQTALGLKEAAEQIQAIAVRTELTYNAGNELMAEASMDLLIAELEYMQKAVLSLTEYVVDAVGDRHTDESAFGTGELNSVVGEKNSEPAIVWNDVEVDV